ncbi:hypothetical protein Q1695_003081 [Nippostrongylus brasiliensis]|nr:hypothetical protein Q1695_003081 [Nippostrongylus brasiliensis]
MIYSPGSVVVSNDLDEFRNYSVSELLNSVLEHNTDPIMERMIIALSERFRSIAANGAEEDRRSRSIVIAGLPEEPNELPPSRRQVQLQASVIEVLDALDVQSLPCATEWVTFEQQRLD